jgi:LysR family transcriptional regulator for metE and metH
MLIAEDELVGIVHRSHVCAKRGRMTAGDIVDDPYLAHALTPQRGFEFENLFTPARQVPRYIARIESLTAIVALVAAGRGVSIQPRSAIRQAVVVNSIVAVPLSPKPIQLPWHLHMHPSALALHGEHLMEEIAAVLRPYLSMA